MEITTSTLIFILFIIVLYICQLKNINIFMSQISYEYKSVRRRQEDLNKFLNKHAKNRWKLLLVKGNDFIFERAKTKRLGRPPKYRKK